MKRALFRLRFSTALLSLGLMLGSGCTAFSTDSTEVGVRTKKIFGAGIDPHIYPPGATYFFTPFLSDWATFDIKLQNLEMTAAKDRGDRAGDDAVEFKTTDGNDIRVNVTVAWRIEPERAPHLLQRVGRSTAEIKEKLVRPACRTYVRDVLNELHSEEFYVSEKRFQKAQKALEKLRAELGPEGIVVEQMLLGEHSFNAEYQKVIQDRKLAEQNAERLKSEAQAAEAEAQRNLEKAKGDVQAQVAKAKGEAEQIHIAADREFYEKEREAKAILAEATARAKSIEKQNKAMAGAGGRTAVKLRIADALQGKPIMIVPAGNGAALQKLDLNRMLESIIAQEARSPSKSSSSSDD
ncbi:MAG TPA: SPFH domain-containing protein [Pseudomonadota bacterium]|nr:SPFH domain-containing protein [Pseudomonadota bacterium]